MQGREIKATGNGAMPARSRRENATSIPRGDERSKHHRPNAHQQCHSRGWAHNGPVGVPLISVGVAVTMILGEVGVVVEPLTGGDAAVAVVLEKVTTALYRWCGWNFSHTDAGTSCSGR